MQTRCPHCDKPIKPGAILCMHCGSYVVKVDEKKRRWHLFAIPVVMILVVAGLLLYMEYLDQQRQAKREAARQAERVVDPAVARQQEQDEAERRRIILRREQIEEEKRKKAARRAAYEAWRARPTAEKVEYLTTTLNTVRGRIKLLRSSSQTEATMELNKWLARLDARVAAVDSFLEAEQYDLAKSQLETVQAELAELFSEEPEDNVDTGSGTAKADDGAQPAAN